MQCILFFFFNDTATTEIYTLSLHDALPIFAAGRRETSGAGSADAGPDGPAEHPSENRGAVGARYLLDRKSTRLNSSHLVISYAVFCLKKNTNTHRRAEPLHPLARPLCVAAH